ncbi:MAG: NAD(P)-dependent glycerol-3-phosphate dehydrogenase [Deltaproteobacteria bacterium]|nr:NAD(P)-dependent glycerol-3-phosphate dehydrogenase [Deltaproteobacteria bacterium]
MSLDALVVGGGSFGTALATILAGMDRRVRLWVRREEQADEINRGHTNQRYLPDFELPESLQATIDLQGSLSQCRVVLMSVPSRSFRSVARQLGDHLRGDQILVHTTKGIEKDSFSRMSEILRQETCVLKVGVLSGPNLARELMAGHPAGALIASRYDEVIAAVQALFAQSRLRVYGGRDVTGTELGGAFKNIIALAAGVADGLGFGDNTKSLLITRGLSEMARFGVARGADVFTFGGLAGIGDLMATCASPLSRNHKVGEQLAAGKPLEEILSSMAQVAEGVPTTEAVYQQCRRMGLDLPIVRAVHGMLFEGWSPQHALETLMGLDVGRELAALRFN